PLPSSSSLPTTSTSEIYTLSLHDALPIFGGHSDLDANARFRLKWSVYWYDKPLNDHLVLYESFDGNGALCNPRAIFDELLDTEEDRKSTRLNSSHVSISYAVFCLKKKKKR